MTRSGETTVRQWRPWTRMFEAGESFGCPFFYQLLLGTPSAQTLPFAGSIGQSKTAGQPQTCWAVLSSRVVATAADTIPLGISEEEGLLPYEHIASRFLAVKHRAANLAHLLSPPQLVFSRILLVLEDLEASCTCRTEGTSRRVLYFENLNSWGTGRWSSKSSLLIFHWT